MDNQNQNLEHNGQIPENIKQQEDLIFFNVMPKIKSSETITEPTLKIANNTEQHLPPQHSQPMAWLKSHKLYVIAGLAVVIGGPLVYFGINYLFNKPQTDSILVKDIDGNLKQPRPDGISDATTFTTPQEWRSKFFPDCGDASLCGDQADPDRDGLTNIKEQQLNTDPNNADSDQDGLADGDETNVFGSQPLNAHTSNNQKYNDADYVKGAFNFSGDQPLTTEQISEISGKMATFKLHLPTITTVGDVLNKVYHFSDTNTASTTPGSSAPVSSTTPISGFDQSVEAKQDRDAQRSTTIRNIGIALIKYQSDTKQFPPTNDFKVMYDKIKPYLRVATKPQDPINIDPYIYGYASNDKNDDFTLSFFSEVAGQIIKKHSADAQKDKTGDEAAIFDNQRKTDLESLKVGLLLYSSKNTAGNQDYVFPQTDKYKIVLVPEFIGTIPKDPKTGKDYEYQVSETFNTFTLKTVLDNPSSGTTGYLCNQEECREY